MTWVSRPQSLPRMADDLICGQESGAEVVYAECREAEQAADRRHDFSDHLGSYGELEAAWSWHMGPSTTPASGVILDGDPTDTEQRH